MITVFDGTFCAPIALHDLEHRRDLHERRHAHEEERQ